MFTPHSSRLTTMWSAATGTCTVRSLARSGMYRHQVPAAACALLIGLNKCKYIISVNILLRLLHDNALSTCGRLHQKFKMGRFKGTCCVR